MGKSLQNLFDEIANSEELRTELEIALEFGNHEAIEEFLLANGCDATIEEARLFLEEKGLELADRDELTAEEWETAATGTAARTETMAVFSLFLLAGLTGSVAAAGAIGSRKADGKC